MTRSRALTLDLSGRHDLEWFARLLADLRSAAPAVEWLLVGAMARDLLLQYGHGIEISRATRDVDFALAIASWNDYLSARGSLLARGMFEAYPGTPHRLRHARYGWIDLVPFGAVERGDGTIAWPPAGDEVMTVIGYAEAAASAVHVELPLQETARIVSLPMLAVLKIFAWKDRHRVTAGKDAVDLGLILRHYLDAGNLDRLYSEFPQLLTDRFDFVAAGAWVLGHDARAGLLAHSVRFDEVFRPLDEILSAELDPDRGSDLVARMDPSNPDRGLVTLAAVHAGIMGRDIPDAR